SPAAPGVLQRDRDWLGAVAAEMGIHIDFMAYSSGEGLLAELLLHFDAGVFPPAFLDPAAVDHAAGNGDDEDHRHGYQDPIDAAGGDHDGDRYCGDQPAAEEGLKDQLFIAEGLQRR